MAVMRIACGAGAMLLIGAAVPAAADDIPNLVGTWTTRTSAVLQGNNLHRPSHAKGPIFPTRDIDFRYVIKEQPDSRFAGEMSGGAFTESFVGDIAPPAYKSGVMAGHDGSFAFTIRDPDTLDVCYTQFGPARKIADCFTLKRQK